ncbi:MAG: glycosyltransferase family 2 protein [Elusimicrobiota bacterium]|jgi:glycosyltransferase involved in cell wall biosynthesis|nr:glycosyltransferase family 2 protein [Elusimicrobiota bacterium]
MKTLVVKKPILVVICPCYNEEEILPKTIERLTMVLDSLVDNGKINSNSFILFVDDGSGDKTWDIVIGSNKKRIRGIKLSANRGHQNALIAGMEYVKDKCDCLISIDSDGQQPESAIEEFLDKFMNGSDIVFGVRNDRNSDSFFKKASAQLFYNLMIIMGVKIIKNSADFRLLSARANEAVLKHEEINLFLRGIVTIVGFKTDMVYFDVKERELGESKYTWHKMFSFALDAILSFSIIPIRIISLSGIIAMLVGMYLSLKSLYEYYFLDNIVLGWASTVIPIYFIGGVQLLSMGIIGEYIGRIYKETKKRPRYFIDKFFGGGGYSLPEIWLCLKWHISNINFWLIGALNIRREKILWI